MEKTPVTIAVEPEAVVAEPTPIWKHILWAVVTIGFLYALSRIPNTLIVLPSITTTN